MRKLALCWCLFFAISEHVRADAAPILRQVGAGSAGVASRIAMTTHGADMVITAVKNGKGNLQLIAWGDIGERELKRRASIEIGAVDEIAIANYDAGVVTAIRNGGGILQLDTWEIVDDQFRRLGTYRGSDKIVEVAALYHLYSLVTAVRKENGQVEMQSWSISSRGDIQPLQSVLSPDENTTGITIGPLSLGVYTTSRTAQGRLRFTRWEYTGASVDPSRDRDRPKEEIGRFHYIGMASGGPVDHIATSRSHPALPDDEPVFLTVASAGGKLQVGLWSAVDLSASEMFGSEVIQNVSLATLGDPARRVRVEWFSSEQFITAAVKLTGILEVSEWIRAGPRLAKHSSVSGAELGDIVDLVVRDRYIITAMQTMDELKMEVWIIE